MTTVEEDVSSAGKGERRSSIEGLKAVRQTFADGIASLRERVSTRPRLESAISDPEFAAGSDEIRISAVTSGDSSQRKEVDRLNAMLEASEARGDAAQEEADRLRAENRSLNDSVDRLTRLLNNLRIEYDRLRSTKAEKDNQDSSALAETVRLRSQVVEMEREVQGVTSRLEEASKSFVEEKKKREGLERVCMGLRRRVAVAEEKAQDEKKMQEAIMARESAESQLLQAKVDAERWRARSAAADVARERAESAERLERIQREKIVTLEKELQSREALLRQGIRERKKLKEFMANYEKELEEKEMKLSRLRSFVKERGYHSKGNSHNLGRELGLGLGSEEETDMGTNTSLSLEKGIGGENDTTGADWDQELSPQTVVSEPHWPDGPNRGVAVVEASPLLREVEEAHAQLQAAFRPSEGARPEALDTDLSERVRRLEESFGRLAHTRSPSE